MRVLHFMVYDGPGGYCRVIYDLCRFAKASEPSVAVMNEAGWTERLRTLGVPVVNFFEIVSHPDPEASLRGLEAMVDGVDLVNVHVGPMFQDRVQTSCRCWMCRHLSTPCIAASASP